jgi:hypothetical protein
MRNHQKQTLTKYLTVVLVASFISLAAGAQQSAGPSKISGATPSASPAAATAANPAVPASSAKVVLKVGDLQITQSDMESIVPMRPSGGGHALSPDARRHVAEALVRMMALSQQAVNDHLDASPELHLKLEMQRIRMLGQAELDKMKSQIQITPDEIHKYYADHPLAFDTVQLREFLIRKQHGDVKDALSAEQAKARAESVREALASGKRAEEVAEEFPGPDVLLIDQKPRTFRNDELIPALQKAVFEAKDGEVPAAVDTPEAEIVMDVLQRQHVEEKDAATQIEKELRQRKLDAQIDDMKKKVGIWMDDSYFKDAPGSVPAATAHAPTSDPN